MTPLDRVRRYVEETAGCEDWIDGPHWAQLLRSDLRAVLASVSEAEMFAGYDKASVRERLKDHPLTDRPVTP